MELYLIIKIWFTNKGKNIERIEFHFKITLLNGFSYVRTRRSTNSNFLPFLFFFSLSFLDEFFSFLFCFGVFCCFCDKHFQFLLLDFPVFRYPLSVKILSTPKSNLLRFFHYPSIYLFWSLRNEYEPAICIIETRTPKKCVLSGEENDTLKWKYQSQ